MTASFPVARSAVLLTLWAVAVHVDAFGGQETVPGTPTLPGIESPVFPYADPEEVGLSDQTVSALAERVAEWAASGEIVGGELMIVKDDRIVLHEAAGWSDRERRVPLQRNSFYRIRSMTKPIIGTAILMLVEEGKISLDDSVTKYLPSFDNERSGAITIRQLLRHQAGYEQTAMPNGYWRQRTLREAIVLLGRIGPANPSGDLFRYSDKNPAALAAIIAELTGEPAERFIEPRIFEPLGLSETHTFFAYRFLGNSDEPDIPSNWRAVGEVLEPQNASGIPFLSGKRRDSHNNFRLRSLSDHLDVGWGIRWSPAAGGSDGRRGAQIRRVDYMGRGPTA